MKYLANDVRFVLSLMICSFLIVSCENFLAENPEHMVTESNYYQTEEDAIAAVNSIYGYLGSYSTGNTAGIYHSTFWITAGLASDNMRNNQVFAVQNSQLETFSYTAENANVQEIWKMHYKTITMANIAIHQIPGIDMDSELRSRLVNEAKFLRALLYFNLVRMYGSVPLLTTEDEPVTPEPASVEDIYDQIVSDLTDAEALPEDGDIQEGRATRGAARSLLAKVYLAMEEYEDASDKAFEVIDSNNYGLWEDYADVFKIENRGGKEAVFSVGFGDAGGAISFWEVGQMNVRLLPAELQTERSGVTNANGWQYATQNLYDDFSANDERRDVTFMTEFTDDDGNTVNLDEVYIQKYWDRQAEPNAGNTDNDFPVIRYAEVLLIYAEAEAELENFGEANDYLNMVRNRAELTDVNINDTEAFKDAILQERRKEFVAEGHRWFDLVRLDALVEQVEEAKDVSINDNYALFPIPQRERDNNPNLPQNPGY